VWANVTRMKLDALLRAAQMLRAQPAHTMPLVTLHARLYNELGAGVGTYAEVYQQLKNRPQSFSVIDSPRLLDATDSWPQHVREEYGPALETVGIGSCMRVTLTEPTGDGANADAIAMAGETISGLWRAAEGDAELRDYLARATDALEAIAFTLQDAAAAPTTTPLPDLPRAR
jgi:hypothetical protein